MTTFTLSVTNVTDSADRKHVSLLRDGVVVLSDHFEQPFSLPEVGQMLLSRYETPAGVYDLSGNLLPLDNDTLPELPSDSGSGDNEQDPEPLPEPTEPDPDVDGGY